MSFKKSLTILITIGLVFGLTGLYFRHLNLKKTKKPSYPRPIARSNDHYSFKSTGGNFTTYFPDNLIDQNSDIKVEKKDSSLTFSLLSSQNKKIVGQAQDNRITYPKISQSGSAFIDLRYTVAGNRIMEEFILNQKQTFPVFKQKINLFNTYVAKSSDSIQFNHPTTDKLLWYIPTPFMYEQNHPETKHSGIKFNLECESPNTPLKDCRIFILTKQITPEGQAWLDDPARNYPVIIDPTVADSCWGVGGYCDSGCVYGAVSGSTVYTTCSNGSLCAGTNCWYTSAGTCNTGCTSSSVTAVTAYTTCSNGSLCAGTNCWYTSAGTCNSGCTSASVSSVTAYTTCSNGSLCAGTNCWYTSAGTCDSGCNQNGVSSASVYTTCSQGSMCAGTGWVWTSNPNLACAYSSYSARTTYTSKANCTSNSSPYTRYYNFTGTCSTNGTGSCYAPSCAVQGYYYYNRPTCSSAYHYGATCPCTWTTPTYPWTVSGNTVTKYTGNGSACASGSGNCYKLTNGATTYTGNGTACPTGSSNCAGVATRYDATQCSWATAKYPKVVSNSGTWYTGSGSCAAGSGTCYYLHSGATTYTGNGAGCPNPDANCAGAATRYQRTQCSWAPAKYPKVVSNSTTRYTGSGSCTPGGSGSCYKLTQDSSNTYTGNGTGCPNPDTDCAGAARRYTSQTCTWYGELGGDSLRFSGIRLERIRVN
jgi:hypothetical protein